MTIQFSKQFYHAAQQTWEYIGADAYEMCGDDNEIAWEFVLDAGRIGTYGSLQARQELANMMVNHSWQDILAHCAKKHPLL